MIFQNYDRIVFAGDSVTDMGSKQPVGEGLFDNLGHGFVRIVESLLSACYPDVNLRITNSGISGNTSRDLLERFDRDVISLKPDWLCICIGINDVWRQFDTPAIISDQVMPDEYTDNLEKMIVSAKDFAKGIFIATPYYIEINSQDKMRKRMNEYVEICKVLAAKYNCRLVNFQEMYENYCCFQHSSRIAWDRVHPNQIGAVLMAREFLRQCDFDYNREMISAE